MERINKDAEMKFYSLLFIFLISCISNESIDKTTQVFVVEDNFSPATTIQSDYDKLPEGDKTSYKIRKYWIQNILKDAPIMTITEKNISYREANNPTKRVYLDDGTTCLLDVGGTIHGSLIDENFQLDLKEIEGNKWSNKLENFEDSLFNDGYQITLEVSYNCGKSGEFSWLYGPLFFQSDEWWSFTDMNEKIDFPVGYGFYWRQSTRVKVNLSDQ